MTKEPENTICRNRKAAHRFQILDRVECGLVLRGAEVKSLRQRNASIEEAYARIDGDELWLIGCHIAAYPFAGSGPYDAPEKQASLRRRKLLLHRREIRKLKTSVEQKGLTLIPLRMFFNHRGVAKVSLGVARGKKLTDKRQALQARDARRDIERALRRRR